MTFVKSLVFVAIVLTSSLAGIEAHGMLMDPVNRGSAFRKGFSTPKNYDDNANYCGGFGVRNFISLFDKFTKIT